MTKEEYLRKSEHADILERPEYKAAHTCFQNGCMKGYELEEMAHYMFLQGIKFAKTGKMPELLD